MKAGGSKRQRGIDKTNLERLDQTFVEVLSKEEIAKSNLIKSILKSRFPVQLRRCPRRRNTRSLEIGLQLNIQHST
jgi:hypothetical protein